MGAMDIHQVALAVAVEEEGGGSLTVDRSEAGDGVFCTPQELSTMTKTNEKKRLLILRIIQM